MVIFPIAVLEGGFWRERESDSKKVKDRPQCVRSQHLHCVSPSEREAHT